MYKQLFLALLFGLLLGMPAAASIEMHIEPGFDGQHVHGTWAYLAAVVENSGEAVSGRFVLELERGGEPAGRYEIPMQLPAESERRWRFTMPTVIDEQKADLEGEEENDAAFIADHTIYSFLAKSRSVAVTGYFLVNGETAARAEKHARDLNLEREQVLVVGRERAGFDFLALDEDRPLDVIYAHVRSLPQEWVAYSNLSAVVIADGDLGELNTMQEQAITQWVQAGGNLVVTGETLRPNLRSSLLSGMFGEEPSRKQTVEVNTAEGEYGNLIDLDMVESWHMREPSADVLAHADGVPLLLRQRRDSGAVHVLTFDPKRYGVGAWPHKAEFFQALLTPELTAAFDSLPELDQHANAMLHSIPLAIAGRPAVAWALGLFVLLAAVCFYTGVRSNRRVFWGLMLLLLIGFSSGTYFLFGQTMYANQDFAKETALIEKEPDSERAMAQSYFTLYSNSGKADRTLRLPRSFGLPYPLTPEAEELLRGLPTVVLQGGESLLTLADGNLPAVQSIKGQYQMELPILAAFGDDSRTLHINNESRYAMEEVYLRYDGYFYILDPVASEEARTFDFHDHRRQRDRPWTYQQGDWEPIQWESMLHARSLGALFEHASRGNDDQNMLLAKINGRPDHFEDLFPGTLFYDGFLVIPLSS